MTDVRHLWATYIQSRDYIWRFLYARGDVSIQVGVEKTSQEVERFLNLLLNRSNSISYLSRIYYLTHPRVASFFQRSLPELMRSASKVTYPREDLVRG